MLCVTHVVDFRLLDKIIYNLLPQLMIITAELYHSILYNLQNLTGNLFLFLNPATSQYILRFLFLFSIVEMQDAEKPILAIIDTV